MGQFLTGTFISLSPFDQVASTSLCNLYLQKQVKKKKRKNKKKTFFPFHYICKNSDSNGFNIEILRYCCEIMKADINLKNNYDGETPFDYLCILKYHKIMRFLSKNNIVTDETIKNSKLTTKNKLRYFTQSTNINLNDPNYVLY